MTDTKELIERLRELAAGSWNTTCAEAADLLERQSEAVGGLVSALRNLREQASGEEHGDDAAEEFCPVCQRCNAPSCEAAREWLASIDALLTKGNGE